MASINGNDKPKFGIYTKDGNKIEDIQLNLTDTDGLIEDFELIADTEHEMLDYRTDIEWAGFHIYFTLSYNSYSSNSNTMKIGKLIQHILSNKTIKLQPRIDLNLRDYEVICLNKDSISMGVLKGGAKSIGNRLTVLKFKTKYLQTNINWYDLDNLYVAIDFNDFAKV